MWIIVIVRGSCYTYCQHFILKVATKAMTEDVANSCITRGQVSQHLSDTSFQGPVARLGEDGLLRIMHIRAVFRLLPSTLHSTEAGNFLLQYTFYAMFQQEKNENIDKNWQKTGL